MRVGHELAGQAGSAPGRAAITRRTSLGGPQPFRTSLVAGCLCGGNGVMAVVEITFPGLKAFPAVCPAGSDLTSGKTGEAVVTGELLSRPPACLQGKKGGDPPIRGSPQTVEKPGRARENRSPLEFQSTPAACTAGSGRLLRRNIPFSGAKIVSLQFLRPESVGFKQKTEGGGRGGGACSPVHPLVKKTFRQAERILRSEDPLLIRQARISIHSLSYIAV